MNSVVVPIDHAPSKAARPRRTTRIEHLQPQEGEVVWQVSAIPTQEESERWIERHIEGMSYERLMRMLWAQEPRARKQVHKLISFITPKWPAPNGQSLMGVALDAAGAKLTEVLEEGDEYKPRLIGAFLWGLMSVHPDVARLGVRGLDRAGRVQHWHHFSMSILEWARAHGMTEVLASDRDDCSSIWLRGLRTTMVASIAHPTEIGFMERYAPHG
jgi:hypothetical protein